MEERKGNDDSVKTPKPSVNIPKIVIDPSDSGDDATWEAEKEKCSFCKAFLGSPCKDQFKYWSKCVDKAKTLEVDFAVACSDYTKALMECTSANGDYFSSLSSDNDDDEDGSDSSNDSGNPNDSDGDNKAPSASSDLVSEDKSVLASEQQGTQAAISEGQAAESTTVHENSDSATESRNA